MARIDTKLDLEANTKYEIHRFKYKFKLRFYHYIFKANMPDNEFSLTLFFLLKEYHVNR